MIDIFFAGVAGIAVILIMVVALLPRKFFRKEIIYMNKKQEMKIYNILKETGSASIYLSISVLSLSIEFLIENAILTLVVVFALFIYAFFREKKSSNLAHELAISLINSSWYKKYSAKLKK